MKKKNTSKHEPIISKIDNYTMEARIYEFGNKKFAYVTMLNLKTKEEEYFNTLHTVGSQSLEELKKDLNNFEVADQVFKKYRM